MSCNNVPFPFLAPFFFLAESVLQLSIPFACSNYIEIGQQNRKKRAATTEHKKHFTIFCSNWPKHTLTTQALSGGFGHCHL